MAQQEGKPTGRPTLYREEYDDLAYKFSLLGATDAKMAEFFGVTEQTLNNWKEAHPSFFESLARGKEAADAEIADALFHRAKGYKHKAVKMFQSGGEIISEEYIEHYPPDTQAASLWLRNRQPKLWRDKTEQALTGADGGPIRFQAVTELTNEQLAIIAAGGKIE